MPQFLLEIFSEEIPARMQQQAARDLERMARDALALQGLLPSGLITFAGPRRLTLVAEGLAPGQADRVEEAKGPRTTAPDQALDGFLRKTGLTRDQLVERDGVWFARIERPSRSTPEIVAEMVEAIVRAFPWPKSMRWGTGSLRWVRPIKRILCVFDGEVVPFEIDSIASGDLTEGHRVMGSGQPLRARTFEQYAEALQRNFVVLDPDDRKRHILEQARTLCFARNLELIEDPGLLDEVAGLAEWPVPVLGDMDRAFLDLPPEVIRTSMRTHQKYFAVRNPETGALAPHFVTVANIEAVDGGKAIAAGNARVLSARLNDARFFWDEDNRPGNFERWLKKLEGVTFHARLGTMAQRVTRLQGAAADWAGQAGIPAQHAVEAAGLAKADLASAMVGEFPELQGLMGGYYAAAASYPTVVAEAIRDHYRPQGPSDSVPGTPDSLVVALADKLDTLIGFFGVGERPTGSRDPFALRRAALGVIRIVVENRVRARLRPVIAAGQQLYRNQGVEPAADTTEALLAFLADRLKVLLRDQGKRHDLVDAVFALGDDDLVRITTRVEALDEFLHSDDGANLLAGYRRGANILRAESKKNPAEAADYEAAVDPALLQESEEKALYAALEQAAPAVETFVEDEAFGAAMTTLSSLRVPVDAFFDKVLVNAEQAQVRLNRLRLLSQVRAAMGKVADFSQIGG